MTAASQKGDLTLSEASRILAYKNIATRPEFSQKPQPDDAVSAQEVNEIIADEELE